MLLRHLPPTHTTHTHATTRAAPSLSHTYIRWCFSHCEHCRHRASKDRLLRENHEDVPALNRWRSYTDRHKVRWRAHRDHQSEGFGHEVYRASTEKLSYFILFYFILNFFHCFAVFACFDWRVCPINYAAFVSML